MANIYDVEIARQQADLQREMADRQAVASGNVDKNSALYRHAKLNGWNLGGKKEEAGAEPRQFEKVARGKDVEAAPSGRQSPISAFASDGEGRFTRYNPDGTQETAFASPEMVMFQQMGQLVEKGKQARVEKRKMDDAALASGMVYAKQNGGFIPTDILQAMSAQLGQNIVGGNYTSDGNFVLYGDGSRRDPRTGRVIQSGGMVPIAVASPEMQFNVLTRSGLGGDMARGLFADIQKRTGLTDVQLAERGIVNPATVGQKDAVKGQEVALKQQSARNDQRSKLVAEAQKQLEIIGNMLSDANLEPTDPRRADLIEEAQHYRNVIKAANTAGLGEWGASLGIDPTVLAGAVEGGRKARRDARAFEGEEEVKADKTVKQGGFLGMGGRDVPQIEDDTRTGEKVVNTDEDDGKGGYKKIRLADGQTFFTKDKAYTREGDQVFTRPKEELGIEIEIPEKKDGIIFNTGKKEAFIEFGDVIEEGGRRLKLVGDADGYSFVPTTDGVTLTDEVAVARADDYRKGREKAAAKADADRKRAEKERKQREEEWRQKKANQHANDRRVQTAKGQAEWIRSQREKREKGA